MQSTGSNSPITAQMPTLFEDERSIYQAFILFHTKYPRVYELFTAYCLQLIRGGHKKIGAKMVIERIRWEFATGSKDAQGFKINNNFTAHYVRLFQQNYRDYAGYFETRSIRKL